MSFRVGNVRKMLFYDSGGIGIGNVYSDERSTSDPGANNVIIEGNVGIGITDPQNKLNVVGDGNFTGNVTFGENIIPEITSTGSMGSSVLRWLKGWFNGIDVSGDLNQTNGNATINMIYGEMWFHDDTTSVTTVINTQGVWTNITGFDGGDHNDQDLNGFSYFNGTLTAQVSGKYDCSYDISTGNMGNNQEYQFILAINELVQNNTDSHRKIGAAGDVGDASDRGWLDLNIGDDVKFQTKNNDGTSNLLVHAASVNCLRIGDIK